MSAPPPDSSPRPRKTIRLLAMDDAEDIRGMLLKAGRFIDCEVVCVSEGASAVSAYQRAHEEGRPFDAVLLDLVVPLGKGGREAAEDILHHHPEAVLIVTSGYCDAAILAEYKKFGFRAALQKPYTVPKLGEVLRELFP